MGQEIGSVQFPGPPYTSAASDAAPEVVRSASNVPHGTAAPDAADVSEDEDTCGGVEDAEGPDCWEAGREAAPEGTGEDDFECLR